MTADRTFPIVQDAEDEIALLGIRQDVFLAANSRGIAHIASSLSLVEILYALDLKGLMRHHPDDPTWVDRDRLVLSKGHGSLALYAVLARAGYFERKELFTFAQADSRLGGEPHCLETPGVEAATGSLGHGLSIGLGYALAAKMDGSDSRTLVIVGDGECQEGSIWEAASIATKLGLSGLTVIIDDNHIQKSCFTSEVVGKDSLARVWESFGWMVIEVDGHNVHKICDAVSKAVSAPGPVVIVADTVKGKGIGVMEDDPAWHYRMPRKRELRTTLADLNLEEEDLC